MNFDPVSLSSENADKHVYPTRHPLLSATPLNSKTKNRPKKMGKTKGAKGTKLNESKSVFSLFFIIIIIYFFFPPYVGQLSENRCFSLSLRYSIFPISSVYFRGISLCLCIYVSIYVFLQKTLTTTDKLFLLIAEPTKNI